METKEELLIQRDKIFKKLQKIEAKEFEIESKQFVGKHFKYRNSYSLPQSEKDYWVTYTKVLSASGMSIKVHEFQIDKHGSFKIEERVRGAFLSGWVEIPASEYKKALSSFKKKIAKF
jgi:hypothetical protein